MSREKRYDSEQLTTLSLMLASRLEELFTSLGVRVRFNGKAWMGPCPVHGGNNPTSFVLYPNEEGDYMPGTWKCWSRSCESAYQGLLGLIMGVKRWTISQSVNFALRLLGLTSLDQVKVDPDELEKLSFARLVRQSERPTEKGHPISTVRARLTVPSPYFVQRGFQPKTLDRYCVGDCKGPNKPFHMRAVVPVLDDDGESAIAYTGRSLYPHCPDCKQHHDGPCPPLSNQWVKWKHSENFARERHLYNWWVAKAYQTIILCESPGDCWRCVEAGFENAVGMFGCSLSDGQQVLLETAGVMKVVIATNMDEAGRKGEQMIRRKLSRSFNLKTLTFDANDLGDLPVDKVRALLEDACG